MRARDRIERGVRQVQLVLTENQHRQLKIRSAMDGMSMSDMLKSRICDVIEPWAGCPAGETEPISTSQQCGSQNNSVEIA